MDKKINVKDISNQLRLDMKQEINAFSSQPKLAVIKVGEDAASEVYVKGKEKACQEVGIAFELIKYNSDIEEQAVIDKIEELNDNQDVHGILVQLPLPKHLDSKNILSMINPLKDVDGLTNINLGKLVSNQQGLVACTAIGVIKLLEVLNIEMAKKHVVMVGRSLLVGKPLMNLFLNKDATVTICHSKTNDLTFYTKQADILVVAIGQKQFIKADMIKKGAILIDVGINRVDNKLYGDIDFDDVYDKCSLITPVPGGIGLMTVTMLLSNVINAYKELNNLGRNI